MNRRAKSKHDNEKYYSDKDVLEKEEVKKFNLFDTGLIIGIITVLGYVIAYAYQKGYWQYYGITQEFITQISIVNILVSITVIVFGIGTLFLSYQGLVGPFRNVKTSIYVRVIIMRFLPSFFILSAILTLVPKNIIEIKPIYFIYGLLALLILCFTSPIISQFKIKGYKNKLTKNLESKMDEGVTTENIVLKYKLYPSAKFFYLYVIFMFSFGIAYAWGYNSAVDRENYLVFDSFGQTQLVIDSTSDKFIVTPVNLSKKEINKTFQVIEIKSDRDKPLILQNVKIRGGIRVTKEPVY